MSHLFPILLKVGHLSTQNDLLRYCVLLDVFKKRRSHHFFPRPAAYSPHETGLLERGLGKAALWTRIQIGTGPDPDSKPPTRFESARDDHPLSGPAHIRDAGAGIRWALAGMMMLVDSGYSQDLRIAALAKVVHEDLSWAKCSPSRRKFLDEQRAAQDLAEQQTARSLQANSADVPVIPVAQPASTPPVCPPVRPGGGFGWARGSVSAALLGALL